MCKRLVVILIAPLEKDHTHGILRVKLRVFGWVAMGDRFPPQELEQFSHEHVPSTPPTPWGRKEDPSDPPPICLDSPDDLSRDRLFCWVAVLLLAALCVLASIMGGMYGYEELEKAHVDVTATSVTCGFGLSLLPWLALVLPYSAVGVVLPYFFNYLPGFPLVYASIAIGSAFSFGAARWLSKNSRWVPRFVACFPGKAEYVKGLRTVFKERCCFLAALAMWGPIPITLMVALVGLLTDADFLIFWLSSCASIAVQLLPMMCIAAESSSIKKTLDSGNPASIAVLVGGFVVFLVLSCVVAHYTSKELDKHVHEAKGNQLACSSPAYSSVGDSSVEPDVFSPNGCSNFEIQELHPAM